jgi:hypothetical protein
MIQTHQKKITFFGLDFGVDHPFRLCFLTADLRNILQTPEAMCGAYSFSASIPLLFTRKVDAAPVEAFAH